MITVGGAANDDWHDAPYDWQTFDLSDLVWGVCMMHLRRLTLCLLRLLREQVVRKCLILIVSPS